MKLGTLLVAIAASLASALAPAQDFPAKPLRMVVGYAPGGGTDIFARMFADKMAQTLGQPVVVDNRAGANGNIGAEAVAKAAPDGYTLLFVVSSHVTNPGLYAQMPFDPIKDFQPIGLVVSTPLLLTASPGFGPNNARELIAFAKANPGKATFASPGMGSPGHLTMEMLKSMAGVDIQVLHYKGAGPAQADVMGGHVNMQIPTLAQALPNAKAGKLKILAQTGATRSSQAPDIGTIAEAGLPGFQSDIWFALLAPAGTPAPVVAKLNAALNQALQAPDILAKLKEAGADPIGGSPEKALALMRDDQARWLKLMKDVGIKPE